MISIVFNDLIGIRLALFHCLKGGHMENRERDRVSQRTSPTEAGRINREVSEERGREQNSGTSAEFGQKIGRAEDLSEGGEMNNRDKNENMNRNVGMGSESTRRSGSESYGSSSGRQSGSSTRDQQSSNISEDRDRSSNRSGSGSPGSSDEGRH
jgi:hypothetical protein